MIALIGGSGLSEIEGFVITEKKEVMTPYGLPSHPYLIGQFSGINIAFLPRHGAGHVFPPHKINYRANIWGLKEIGVTRILSIGATGAIRPGITPGDIVLPDQLIDRTAERESTFFDGGQVIHIDFTNPYCPELREAVLAAGKKTGTPVIDGATYMCTNGPRLETKAEIRSFSFLGADLVGMTAMPEACLAREAELCYAGINIATNYAAGLTERMLTVSEVIEVMEKTTVRLKNLLKQTFLSIPALRRCACKESLRDAGI